MLKTKINEAKKNFSFFHSTRLMLIVVLHLMGAFFLTVFLLLIAAYIGQLGELSSKGLFFYDKNLVLTFYRRPF